MELYDEVIMILIYLSTFGLSDLFLKYLNIRSNKYQFMYYLFFGIIAIILIFNR